MESAWEFLQQLMNPKSIISYGGLTLLLLVIFAETGLFFGFFLPGDSLLFTAGLLCGTELLDASIYTLVGSMCAAATLGNIVGYAFGKRTGKSLFKKDDSLFFKKKYVFTAKTFYEKYGGMALVMGRFLPIIRTFAPILAGVIEMDYKKFTFYNILGCMLWVFSLTLSGYFLGREFPSINDNLHYIIIGMIVVTAVPVISTYLKEKNNFSGEKD